jgi:hypothetical protein
VAIAVDWEDDVVVYNNGETNQSEYMKAMAVLYERWMRGWALPDFETGLKNLHAQEFVKQLDHILDSMTERIQQLRGFWEGLWYGANPDWGKGKGLFPIGPGASYTPEERARLRLDNFWRDLLAIVEVPEEEDEEQIDGEGE